MIPIALPPPGSLEDLSLAVSMIGKQVEAMTHAFQTMTDEYQRVTSLNAELVDHCNMFALALWEERGASDRLKREADWFRNLAASKSDRQREVTPAHGTRFSEHHVAHESGAPPRPPGHDEPA